MTRRCICCGEEVSFTEYWCYANNKDVKAEIKYVCKECMKEALRPSNRICWSFVFKT